MRDQLSTRRGQSRRGALLLGIIGGVLSLSAALLPGAFGADNVISLVWQRPGADRLVASRHALITSRPPFPGAGADEDLSRFRVEVDGTARPRSVRLSLVSIDPSAERVRDRLDLGTGDLEVGAGAVRSPWLVLAADDDDRTSPRLSGRALKAGLGDWIEARVRVGGRRAKRWSIRVGRPSFESGPLAIREVRLSIVVLRTAPGGDPLVGGDLAGAGEVMAFQARVAGEIFSQCAVAVPVDRNAPVRLADPPGPCLIAVGERFGMFSKGGVVRLMVDGERLGPWKIGSEYTPSQTTRLLGRYLEEAGFAIDRYENARISSFVNATSDLLVRRKDGSPARVEPWPGEPLTTDPAQSMDIGAVILEDGIDAYDDMTALSGTLEERTLVRALSDNDPGTIDVIVVNRFAGGGRQGESFIPSGTVVEGGAVIVDLNALARARQSYTLSHELGHVLLDDLGHPDSRGEDEPFWLMHSRSSSLLDGPKRITEAECRTIRASIEKRSPASPADTENLWRR